MQFRCRTCSRLAAQWVEGNEMHGVGPQLTGSLLSIARLPSEEGDCNAHIFIMVLQDGVLGEVQTAVSELINHCLLRLQT